MLRHINSPALAIALLAGLIALGNYSFNRKYDLATYGYDVHPKHQTVSITAEVDNAPIKHRSLKQRQAAALRDVYALTADDAVMPVNLWRAK